MDSGVLGSFPVVLLDANDRIAADVPCEKCSYNLRGLPAHGSCPECGYDTAESVDRTRQCLFHDRMWHRMTADGLRGLSCGLVAVLFMTLYEPHSPPRSGTLPWLILEILIPSVAFTGLLFGLPLTCRRAPRPHRPGWNRLQLAVRALLAIALAGCVLDAMWTLSLLIAAASLHAFYLTGVIAAVPGAVLRTFTTVLGWGFIAAGVMMILNYLDTVPPTLVSQPDFHAAMKCLCAALASGLAVTAWINSTRFRAYGGGRAVDVR